MNDNIKAVIVSAMISAVAVGSFEVYSRLDRIELGNAARIKYITQLNSVIKKIEDHEQRIRDLEKSLRK